LGSGDIRLQSRESSEGGCGSRVARYWGAPCVAQGAPAWDCTTYWYCGTVRRRSDTRTPSRSRGARTPREEQSALQSADVDRAHGSSASARVLGRRAARS